MPLIIKYTTAQYQAKITELEGYYNQLSTHLTRLNELKSQMFGFWDDENAQTAGMALANEIRRVQSTMDQVNSTITFYKSTIDKLDGVYNESKELLEDALRIVDALL